MEKTEAKKFSACSCNISESLVEFLGLQLDFDLTLALIWKDNSHSWKIYVWL